MRTWNAEICTDWYPGQRGCLLNDQTMTSTFKIVEALLRDANAHQVPLHTQHQVPNTHATPLCLFSLTVLPPTKKLCLQIYTLVNRKYSYPQSIAPPTYRTRCHRQFCRDATSTSEAGPASGQGLIGALWRFRACKGGWIGAISSLCFQAMCLRRSGRLQGGCSIIWQLRTDSTLHGRGWRGALPG